MRKRISEGPEWSIYLSAGGAYLIVTPRDNLGTTDQPART
jgi:hypothetical protein